MQVRIFYHLGTVGKNSSPNVNDKFEKKINVLGAFNTIMYKEIAFCIDWKTIWGIWLVMSSYVNQCSNFSKSVDFAGKSFVFGETAFFILLSSVWS